MSLEFEKNEGGPTLEGENVEGAEVAGEPSLEQHLNEVEVRIQQLEEIGVPSQDQISQEHEMLMGEFRAKLAELRSKLGNENISESSEGMMQRHVVDEIIDFRQYVVGRHQELLAFRQELVSLGGERDATEDISTTVEEEGGVSAESEVESVLEIADKSSSVSDFKGKLESSAREEERSDDGEGHSEVVEAAENITEIMGDHGEFGVQTDLPDVGGVDPAGVTEMGPAGGGDVTIDAAHLATVATEGGKADVRTTLEHESIHQKQTRLSSGADGTVVVDPTNKRKMSEEELHEGGAVHGTWDIGGSDDVDGGAVYKQGADFYHRNDPKLIDDHVNKKGDYAGDRVHLQAELSKKAGVTDRKAVKEMGDKAGFTQEEQHELSEEMGHEEDLGMAA